MLHAGKARATFFVFRFSLVGRRRVSLFKTLRCNMSACYFSSGQVAARLGLPRWWLLYLLEKELVPGASLQVPGRRLFTDQDVRKIATALESRPDLRRSAAPAGPRRAGEGGGPGDGRLRS
jgi:hypothetical protein